MKKFVMGFIAAMAMSMMAGSANTIMVTKFHQSYSYSGKATIEYTVGGALPNNAVAEIMLNTGNARATFVQSNIVTGANSHVIDFASSFGGALLLTDASFVMTITEGGQGGVEANLGGVQLWENGPYWAECNVGASKPEEYGYYFRWGDTVGYTRSGGSNEGIYYSGVTWVSSTGERMSSSPFTPDLCPTYGQDISALLSTGYIDSTGNLVAAYDAATAHLGSPWRMPTDTDFAALISNCTRTWITTNGVSGYQVTGKGDYANRSIFLPAAGYGYDSYLFQPYGYCRSSTPTSDSVHTAWILYINASYFLESADYRYYGLSVRPVRGFVPCRADGIITYDPPETQTTPVPVPYAWLDAHVAGVAHESEAYEASAKATAANGRKVWECYVVGLDPSDPFDDFRITRFWMDGEKPMFEFNHTTDGSGNSILPYVKRLGKANLADRWRYVPDGGDPAFRFFAVEVEPPVSAVEEEELGGVQLWENGPYWAECNVGASKPEDYGYYFWWGDTVGYTCSGGTWINYESGNGGYSSGVTWVSSKGVQMSSSPFSSSSCPTWDKDHAALISAGYIDSTGNLVAAHDAAMAHLGSPWRMPTRAEINALISNCTTTWITTNGVSGRLVTGKGDYANRSIFLPATGYGNDSNLYRPGSNGRCWTSTPHSDGSWA